MENVIKYWNNQPCNINHSKKEIGTKEYFDEVEKKKYFVEPHIKEFANFSQWKGKKVLEIGCGIGTDAVNFARNGAIYTGIELSNKSLDITKQRFDVFRLSGTFYNMSGEEDMSFLGENSFDLIYSFGVIHHSPNPKKIVVNMHRLLKPFGVLKIMVYADNSWKKFMIDEKLDQYEAQDDCPIAYSYTHEEINILLKNFNNITMFQDHIFPYKVEQYKNNIYEKQEYFEKMPMDIFRILEKKLGWHLCITATKPFNEISDALLNYSDNNYIESCRKTYVNAEIYPHLEIDNFFPSDLAEQIFQDFPKENDVLWNKYVYNDVATKYELGSNEIPKSILIGILDILMSSTFVKYLEKVTGIEGLYADKNFVGNGALTGGINMVTKGGKLVRHIDYNYCNELEMYRAVNVLVYFNKDWCIDDGGCLELWDKELQNFKYIIPKFNRCFIFATNSETIHGYEEIKSYESRKSINMYYFTKKPASLVNIKPHKTIWKPKNKK